jgi:hypothetical protein
MELGKACTGFRWVTLTERDHWGDAGLDGKILLNWLFRKWDAGFYGIELPQDMEMWRALVYAVMNLRVS